jgi:hypothetical protein
MLVFQVPSRMPLRARLQLRGRVYGVLRRLGLSDDFLYRRAHLWPMTLNALPRPQVEAEVRAAGGELVAVVPDYSLGTATRIESFRYAVRRS